MFFSKKNSPSERKEHRSEILAYVLLYCIEKKTKKNTDIVFGRLARRPIVPRGALQGAPRELVFYKISYTLTLLDALALEENIRKPSSVCTSQS